MKRKQVSNNNYSRSLNQILLFSSVLGIDKKRVDSVMELVSESLRVDSVFDVNFLYS